MRQLKTAVRKIAPDLTVEQYRYFRVHGRIPHPGNPTTFTEKVIWRKLYDRNYLYTKCSDKHLVRDYVRRRIGEDALVPVLFVTRQPDELRQLSSWANTVIKPNHGSAMVAVMPETEPDEGERERTIRQCRAWMDIDFSRVFNERHYAGITRRIMVEAFVGDRTRPAMDCKVHCFPQRDGSVRKMVQLISDRFGAKGMSFYLDGLAPADLVRTIGETAPRIGDGVRPMIEDALRKSEVLCEDFSYVRVDWLMTRDKLYFGELTFTPGAGLSTTFGPELDRRLCALWVL